MSIILVPIDLSGSSAKVLAEASRQARASSAVLSLLHVALPEPDFVGYDPGPQTVRDDVAAELREEHRQLLEMAAGLEEQGIEVSARAVRGPIVETILERGEELGADLIVMGSHGYGALRRTLLGSVSEGVLRRTTRPLLIVPTREPGK